MRLTEPCKRIMHNHLQYWLKMVCRRWFGKASSSIEDGSAKHPVPSKMNHLQYWLKMVWQSIQFRRRWFGKASSSVEDDRSFEKCHKNTTTTNNNNKKRKKHHSLAAASWNLRQQQKVDHPLKVDRPLKVDDPLLR